MTEKNDDVRLPFAACQGEGEHACVLGPNDEIVVECAHGSADSQFRMAQRIAAMFNRDLTTAHRGAVELILAGMKPTVTTTLTYSATPRG